jgi:hypothetical protein
VIDPGDMAAYRAAYQRPHRPIFRVQVWNRTEQIGEVTELLGGNVDCTLTSQVTRRGSITVPDNMMPTDPGDLLAPFGNRLRIFRGISYAGSELLFPVFTGLIMKAERKPRQPCTVSFSDRAVEVDENDFEQPTEARQGQSVLTEWTRLVREGVPDAVFGTHDAINALAAAQVWDDSRSQACDQLADAGGAFWYCLPDGRFVMRRVPWAYHPDGKFAQPVVTYVDKMKPQDPAFQYGAPGHQLGTITDYGTAMSRESVYNSVVGVADQPDGAEPRRAVVRDTAEGSPTAIGSKFGRRVLRIDLPSAADAAVVYHGARSVLSRSRASAEALPWDMVPDPALELGDLVQLNLGTRRLLRVVAEIKLPLTEGGVMSCSGRPLVLPDGTIIDQA